MIGLLEGTSAESHQMDLKATLSLTCEGPLFEGHLLGSAHGTLVVLCIDEGVHERKSMVAAQAMIASA